MTITYECNECGHMFEGDQFTDECNECNGNEIYEITKKEEE